MEDPLHVDIHLARSGEVPLKVYFCGQSSLDQFCQKVIPHLDRVRFFYLLLHKENHKQISGLLETSGRAISLCEFRFAVGSPGLSLSASVMEKISYFAANITILTLRNVDIHLSSLTFPRLLQFCLVTQKGYKVPRVPDVIGFLRGSPLLKNLDLRNTRCSYTDEADNYIEPVSLQHLHQQIDQFAVGRCGCCGCCGDPQHVSPTDIPPLPTARSQQPSTHSQHHRTSVEYHFTVTLWAIFECAACI